MAKNKKKKWVKFRHKIVTAFFYPWFYLYSKIKYRIKFEKHKLDKRQYLIICNHQTVFDQFFVSLLLKRVIYYVCSDDLFNKGFISKMLKYAVAPIPIKKNTADFHTVMDMIRIKNEGGSVAVFPEGNRTFSGKTGYIKPTLAKLMKALKLPVLAVNLEGGFGANPRFSDKIRKGGMVARIKQIIEYDEYKDKTDEECFELIQKAIYVNDYDVMGDRTYKNKNNAEYIERAMYVCPTCGISKFHSDGNIIKCNNCGLTLYYDEKLSLTPQKGEFPFKRVCDWYDYQEDYIHNLDLTPYYDKPLYVDTGTLVLAARYKKPEVLCKDAKITLYADRFDFNDGSNHLIFKFDDLTAVTAQGRKMLTFYADDKSYQIRGDTRFTVLCYLNVYYHYKNNSLGGRYEHTVSHGGASGEFLGL